MRYPLIFKNRAKLMVLGKSARDSMDFSAICILFLMQIKKISLNIRQSKRNRYF